MSTQAVFSKKQTYVQSIPSKKPRPKNSETADTVYKRTDPRAPTSGKSLKKRVCVNDIQRCKKITTAFRPSSISRQSPFHKRNKEPVNTITEKTLKNRVQEKQSFPLPTLGSAIKTGFFILGTICGAQQKSPLYCPFTPFPGACLATNLVGNAMAEYTFSTPAFNPYNQTFTQPQNGNTAQLSNGDLMNVMTDQNVLVRQRIGLNGTYLSTIGPTITSTTLKNPQVTALNNGTYAVAGINSNQLTSIQLYSADDQPMGAAVEIQFYGTTHFEPRVTTLVDGDVVMTWARLNGANHWLYYTRLRWNGSSWATIVSPTLFQSGQADKASCFPLSDGGYILTGHFVSVGYARPLRYVYDSSDNQLASGYINTLNSAYQQTQVRGTQLSNGKRVIAWLVSSATTSNAVSVSYRLFDTNNNPLGPESSIPLSLPIWGSEDVVLDVVAIDDGFIITLTANTDSSSTDIFQQRFDLSGTNVTDITQVGNFFNGTRPYATRILGTSRWLITWLNNTPMEIYLKLSQLFNGTMSSTSPPTTTSSSSAPSTTTNSSPTSSSTASSTTTNSPPTSSSPPTTTPNSSPSSTNTSNSPSSTSVSSSSPTSKSPTETLSTTSVSPTANQSTPPLSPSSFTPKIITRISSSSPSLGKILGAIFGAVAFIIFILSIVGGFIWKRRRNQVAENKLEMPESPYIRTFNSPKLTGATEYRAVSEKPTESQYVNFPPKTSSTTTSPTSEHQYENIPKATDSTNTSPTSEHQYENFPPKKTKPPKTGTEYVAFNEEQRYVNVPKELQKKDE